MTINREKAWMCPIAIGILLILIGLIVQIPGGALTTSSYMNGESTDYYVFDNKYSSIDEYVGGDAYNYIIGASLVAGKIAGTIAAKSVFIASGLICLCFGLTLMIQQIAPTDKKEIATDSIEDETIDNVASVELQN